jgi:hypothetical protein
MPSSDTSFGGCRGDLTNSCCALVARTQARDCGAVTTRKRNQPETTSTRVPSTPARSGSSSIDEGRAGPPFLLSYARAKGPVRPPEFVADANESVERLFMDLSNRVAQLIPLPAGRDPGFMDRSLEAGERWSDELLQNLSTCRVFVALLSDPYLHRSRWCAMEWDLFARRQVRRVRDTGRDYGTPILPILWTPMEQPVPGVVAAVQRFVPSGVPPEYRHIYVSEGVLGMSHVHNDAYKAIVWKIARQIQIILSSFQVEPIVQPTTAGLRQSFQQDAR